MPAKKTTILTADDDPQLLRLVTRNLQLEGYDVIAASDGQQALTEIEQQVPDLVLLDVMMPKMDGFTVCYRVREFSSVPIIIVTARGQDQDKVRGLDLGADDYLIKPFSVDELLARVRALIRRGRVPTAPRVALGALSLDLVAREARVHGELLDLTAREWAIMELFVTQPGVALSKDRIVQSLSSWDEKLSHNAIEVYVSRLRTKLESAGVRIRTVRGFGYMLETPRA